MKTKKNVIIAVMVMSLILHPSISAVAAAGETAIPGSGMLGDMETEIIEEEIIVEELIVENNPGTGIKGNDSASGFFAVVRTGDSVQIILLLLFVVLSGCIFLSTRKKMPDHSV